MRAHFIKKRANLGITLIDFIYGLTLAILLYGSYIYIPLLYKKQELQGLVKDYTFRSANVQPTLIRQAIIEDAKRKYDIDLNEDDVIVTIDSDWTKIDATWRVVIELPFNYKINQDFHVEYDRKIL